MAFLIFMLTTHFALAMAAHVDSIFHALDTPTIYPKPTRPFAPGQEYTLHCDLYSNNTRSNVPFPLAWSMGSTTWPGTAQQTGPTTVVSTTFNGVIMHYSIDYRFTADRTMNGQDLTCTARLPTGDVSTSMPFYVYNGTLCDNDPCVNGEPVCFTRLEELNKYQCFYPWPTPAGHPYTGPDPCSRGVCVHDGDCTYDRVKHLYTCVYSVDSWESLVN